MEASYVTKRTIFKCFGNIPPSHSCIEEKRLYCLDFSICRESHHIDLEGYFGTVIERFPSSVLHPVVLWYRFPFPLWFRGVHADNAKSPRKESVTSERACPYIWLEVVIKD